MGKVATQPLPPGGSPAHHSDEANQKWPTGGQGGYMTPAASGVPTVLERGTKSEVAHKWARWLHNPCRLGGSKGQNERWPTSGQGGYIIPAALGTPPLESRGQNQRWPTSVQGGYITHAALEIPSA